MAWRRSSSAGGHVELGAAQAGVDGDRCSPPDQGGWRHRRRPRANVGRPPAHRCRHFEAPSVIRATEFPQDPWPMIAAVG